MQSVIQKRDTRGRASHPIARVEHGRSHARRAVPKQCLPSARAPLVAKPLNSPRAEHRCNGNVELG
jgi:hypothetical protein